MSLTIVDYNSYIDYKITTKQIRFTDTTDYAAQGVLPVDVTIVLKVEDPSGVIYNNTNHSLPDINPNVSLDSTIVIPLTIDSVTGEPLQGDYIVTAEYQDSTGTPYTINKVKTFTLNYVSPVVDLDMVIDYITPRLSSIDNTGYTVQGVTPTVSRSHEIHYPLALSLPDITGNAATLSTDDFYYVSDGTLEHSSNIISDLSYDFGGGLFIVDEITGQHIENISPGTDLCSVYCCIRTQFNRYEAAKQSNSKLAIKELAIFETATSLSSAIDSAMKCGKNDHVADYISELEKVTNCDSGCECDDGTPQLVVGLASNGNTVVVAPGTGMSVSFASGGGTDTYTVSLTTINSIKLASTYNSVVAAGDNVTSVIETSVTSGGVTTKTYTVNVDNMIEDSSFVRSKIEFVNGTVPVLTIVSQKQNGITFSAVNQTVSTEFLLNNNSGSVNDWYFSFSSFTVGNFFSSAIDYFPSVDIVNINYKPIKTTGSLGGVTSPNTKTDINVEIVSMSASGFNIRFIDKDGNPVNGNLLHTKYNSIELIFKIQG